MDLRKRISIVGAVQLAALSAVLFGLYFYEARASVQQQYVEKARAIVMTAESTREEMGLKWNQEIFSTEALAEWSRQGEHEKILSTVPVVTAWRAARQKAAEGGYEFRVPKFQPRNPANEPDEMEARVLKAFEAGATEHIEIDPEMNAVRFFRPIRLTRECLMCHGDPATAPRLWGNDKGLDPTGGHQWMGYRPSLPDSLPVIGQARLAPNAVYAFGHGHLGLTQAAATGRLVRDLVRGQTAAIDLAPFSPQRF